MGRILFAIAGIGVAGYGIHKKVILTIKRKLKKNVGEAVKRYKIRLANRRGKLYEE